MARILITGSADGLGRASAQTLLEAGHQVVVHTRNRDRLAAVRDLLDQGAEAAVNGDLADVEQTREGRRAGQRSWAEMDAVIHNAGVYTGFPDPAHQRHRSLPAHSTHAAPPPRLIYLSSGMHRGGRAVVDGRDWSGRHRGSSYSDSKLFVTTLAAAVARIWPDVLSNSVDPGWVPDQDGRSPALPTTCELGHLTQEWLATSDDPEARTSGGYWHHQRLRDASPRRPRRALPRRPPGHTRTAHGRAAHIRPRTHRRRRPDCHHPSSPTTPPRSTHGSSAGPFRRRTLGGGTVLFVNDGRPPRPMHSGRGSLHVFAEAMDGSRAITTSPRPIPVTPHTTRHDERMNAGLDTHHAGDLP